MRGLLTCVIVILTAAAVVTQAGHRTDGALQVTTHPALDSEPDWSPDGSLIAFASDRDGEPEVWVVSPGGGDPTKVTDGAYSYCDPDWSPDGEWIAVKSDRGGCYNGTIWKVTSVGASYVEVVACTPGIQNGAPSWSPDGLFIAYNANDIFVVPSEGGEPENLTPDPSLDITPDWSPCGTEIAYVRDSELWSVPSSGGEPRQLSDLVAGTAQWPDWSPDGSRIAFGWTGPQADNMDIWVLSLPSGALTRVTTDLDFDSHPSWSPDGSHIAFVSARGDDWNIWVIPWESPTPASRTGWGRIKALYR